MYKAKDISGKPVITKDTGEIVHRADRALFDPDTRKIAGILVEGGSLLFPARIIPFENISALGPDAITVATRSCTIGESDRPALGDLISKDKDVRDKRIITEDGQDLGTINDIVFDETTGDVQGFEVTGGAFADIYKGRPFLPVPQLLKVGKEVIFVPNDTKEIVEQQSGGLKAAAEKISEKTGKYAEQAGQATQNLTARTRRYAREYTGGEQGTQLKEQSKNAWQRLVNQANQWWSRTNQDYRDRRTEFAIGKPVTRVIYDQNDNIILNTGDIITHQAVEKADQAGVLSVLLDSVYTGKPDLSTEELKAPEDEEDRE